MNQNEIIAMAKEAGMHPLTDRAAVNALGTFVPLAWIERFAALVAAAEREACAQLAKAISDKYGFGYYGNEVDTADEIEAAIRARGTKEGV